MTTGLGPAFLDPDALERGFGSVQIEVYADATRVWLPVTDLVPIRSALTTLAPDLPGPSLTRLVQHLPGREPHVTGYRHMRFGDVVELRVNLEPPISA